MVEHQERGKTMKRFEYKTEKSPGEQRLNQLGAKGWQLVAIQGNEFCFIREAKEGQE